MLRKLKNLWPLYPMRQFWQRGRRGWASGDTWEMHSHLSGVLAEMTEYLAENHIGHPVFFEGDTAEFDCDTEEGCAKADEKWRGILLGIADGFRAAQEIDERFDREDTDEYKERKARFDDGMRLFHDYFFHLWD